MAIDTVKIKTFSSIIHHEAEQMTARTLPFCEFRPMSGEEMFYDSFGSVEAIKANGRKTKGVGFDQPWSRRKITTDRFYVQFEVDKYEVDQMLTNPDSAFVKKCRSALERVKDRVVVDAALASVLTGKNGTTLVTAANDGVTTVDATAGLTYEKLLEISENFLNAEVPETARKGFMISGTERTDLMGETELTSGDFSRQYAIDNMSGLMVRALDMNLISFAGSTAGTTKANPILPEAGGLRGCVAISQGGVCLAMHRDINVEVHPIVEEIDMRLLRATIILGAVRTEGALVQRVNTTIK